MTAQRLGKWGPTILAGLLWGVIVMLLDTLAQPVGDMSALIWLRFSLYVLFQWSLLGVIWAVAARLSERRGRALIGYLLTLVIACCITPPAWMISGRILPFDMDVAPAWMTSPLFDPDTLAYLCWENAFYGGAYFLGYVATRRSVRLRQRLAEIRRARGEADVQLREARLRAYRGQLQPELMLEALAALRAFTQTDPARADRVFEHLVAFLRAAMPAIRSGKATLASELRTLQSYADLRDLIAGEGAKLRLEIGAPIADWPFPPLALLPAVHALVDGLPPDGALLFRAHSHDDLTTLTLHPTPPIGVPQDIAQLRAALRLAFADALRFVDDGQAQLAVEIRHPSQTSATVELQGGDHVLS